MTVVIKLRNVLDLLLLCTFLGILAPFRTIFLNSREESNIFKWIFVYLFLGPPSYVGSYKISLSIRPTVFYFSQEWVIIFFSYFLHDRRWLEYLKVKKSPFFQENSFCPKFEQKIQTVPKYIRLLGVFEKFWH